MLFLKYTWDDHKVEEEEDEDKDEDDEDEEKEEKKVGRFFVLINWNHQAREHKIRRLELRQLRANYIDRFKNKGNVHSFLVMCAG